MISVLIPAYNEQDRIGATIRAVQSLTFHQVTMEVIVVDDGSTDDTLRTAEAAGADVVFHQSHRGKGAALQTAFDLSSGDVLLLIDADLEESAADASKLVDPILQNLADMTVAVFPRLPGRRAGFGAVVSLARWGIRRLVKFNASAPLSGQRAIRREVVHAAGGFAPGWGAEIALTVNAVRCGYRVQEVQTNMSHRPTGRTAAGFIHRGRQFWAAATVLWCLWTNPTEPPTARSGISSSSTRE